jgi:hypothetical protein
MDATNHEPSMKPRTHDQPTGPTEAEIQHEAYRLWLEGGRKEGVELENWFAAKERLLHHQSPASQSTRNPSQKTDRAALRRAAIQTTLTRA